MTAHSDAGDALTLRLSFQFRDSGRQVAQHCNALVHTHAFKRCKRAYTQNHIPPNKSTTQYPLSPGTVKYLKIDAPQNNWDGTWSKETHMCTEESASGSHLRAGDVERKHLEGREVD